MKRVTPPAAETAYNGAMERSSSSEESGGLVLDRDENAALNILRAGQARQALTWPVGTYVA
jgi:transposase